MLVGWCQSVFIRLELSKKNKYDPSPLKTLDQSRSLSKGHVQLGEKGHVQLGEKDGSSLCGSRAEDIKKGHK